MPTYEYKCDNCGHRFDYFQAMSDEPLKDCPLCKGPVRRLFSSSVGIIFKGNGFYSTDYKSPVRTTRCGNEKPCCGRDAPCEKPPCD